MNATTPRSLHPFTAAEWSLVAIHGLVAAGIGASALLAINDPDWGTVQRLVVMMMMGLWAGGIVASGLVARAVRRRWLRVVILVIGPFAILALVIGRSALGWV